MTIEALATRAARVKLITCMMNSFDLFEVERWFVDDGIGRWFRHSIDGISCIFILLVEDNTMQIYTSSGKS
jgi:hypothetical protein